MRVSSPMRIVGILCLSLLSLSFLYPGRVASAELDRTGFWGSVEAGAGNVLISSPRGENEHNRFFLGFTGGYSFTPNLLLGIELSGWNIQPENLDDPSEGEGIMQILGIARFYAARQSGFFLKVGGGYLGHWNNRPNEPRRQTGTAFSFGGGYDFALTNKFAITPFITFTLGKAGEEDHETITFGIGMTFQ